MNILLTSSGRRTYIVEYFKKASNCKGLVHAANSEYSIAMQVADKSVCNPLIYDSGYVDFLLAYCLTNKIGAVMSLFDIDLPILAKAKKRFADKGIQIVVSDHSVTRICNDKYQTYVFLKENKFNAPLTFIELYAVKKALDRGEIYYPVIVKPRWGMGSIGIYQADNHKELDVFYSKVKKDILRSYLNYESTDDLEHCVIVQEKLMGQEYGLDVLNDLEGNFAGLVPKKKVAMRSGETDCAEIVDNDDLTKLGNELSVVLKHCGNLDVDVFEFDGEFYVLEMNCRFGGQYPFSHLAGVNYPAAIISWLRNEKPAQEVFEYRVGTIGVKDIKPTKLLNPSWNEKEATP